MSVDKAVSRRKWEAEGRCEHLLPAEGVHPAGHSDAGRLPAPLLVSLPAVFHNRSDTTKVHVSEAVFERKNKRDKPYVRDAVLTSRTSDDEDDKTKKLRWMHMQQQMHNLSWAEEDEDEGGIGLKIIVLQNMFSLQEAKSSSVNADFLVEPNFKEELMSDVRSGCEPFGVVEKVTIFDTNPDGIVVVKFKSANAAENVKSSCDDKM